MDIAFSLVKTQIKFGSHVPPLVIPAESYSATSWVLAKTKSMTFTIMLS